MPEWKMFPLWEPRPEGFRPFSKKQRDELEFTIACQVADLLGRHGRISEIEVDLSISPDFDEPTTFQEIKLDEIPLEDDGDLIISQLPFSADGVCTAVGAHSVIKQDEDGEKELCLTVWDPSIEVPHRIHDERDKVVNRLTLQELYEALAIILTQMDAESAGNVPALSAGDFPLQVIDPVFEALVMELES